MINQFSKGIVIVIIPDVHILRKYHASPANALQGRGIDRIIIDASLKDIWESYYKAKFEPHKKITCTIEWIG